MVVVGIILLCVAMSFTNLVLMMAIYVASVKWGWPPATLDFWETFPFTLLFLSMFAHKIPSSGD
jgi:hypothetical protein